MAKQALKKDIFREIQKTRSRFISIFVLVALAVAFLAGLRTTAPDMEATADRYLDEQNMMDVQVLATLGLTQEDVDALAARPGVLSAEGSYTVDGLIPAGDNDLVAKVLSISEQGVNQPRLLRGRMPQRADECLVEESVLTAMEADLGAEITIDTGTGTYEDALNRSTFTVVGTCQSPLYLSIQRGSSTLGTGSVACFVLLPRDAFDMDAYTEAYATLDGAMELNAYSDAYKDLTDAWLEDNEAFGDERAQLRSEEIRDEAEEKLADAQREYDEAEAEVNQELADARAELADAREELDDGWAKYSQGWTDLRRETAEAEQELSDGEQELADAYKKLTDGEAEYADGLKKYQDGEVEYADGLAEWQDGKRKYEDGLREYEDGKKKYEDGLREYEDGVKKIEDGWAKYRDGLKQYQDGMAELDAAGSELDAAWAQLQEARSRLDDGWAEYNAKLPAAEAELERYRALLAEAEAGLKQAEAGLAYAQSQQAAAEQGLAEAEAGLKQAESYLAGLPVPGEDATEAEKAAYAAAQQAVETARGYVTAAQGYVDQAKAGVAAAQGYVDQAKDGVDQLTAGIAAGEQALEAARTELENGEAEYESGYQQYQDGARAYDAGAQELREAERELASGRQELADAEAELPEARRKLDEAKAELADGEAELADAKRELDDGWAEVEDGRKELDDAKAELTDARAELDDGWADYNQGLVDLEDGRRELAEETAKARRELADARVELEDGEAEYADGRKEYEDGKAEAETELADARSELRDARRKVADLDDCEWYLLGRKANIGFVSYQQDAERMGNLATVFPLLFFLVAALVCLTTMTRMVEEQRSQIGCLKALGYSKGDIARKFVTYGLLASLSGGVVGLAVGCTAIPAIIIYAWQILYNIPGLVFAFQPGICILAVLAAVVCTAVAVLAATLATVRANPASLMRPKAPKAGKRVLLERIRPIWTRLSFSQKVTVRNLFRYKRRFWMTVIGIAGCTALIVTGFGLRDSILDIMDIQYEEIYNYHAQASLVNKYEEEEFREVAQLLDSEELVDRWLPCNQTAVEFTGGDRTMDGHMFVVGGGEELEGFIELRTRLGHKPVALPEEGLVVTEKLAELLELDVGDTVTLVNGDDRAEAEVSAVTENYIMHYAYLTDGYYEKLFGKAAEDNVVLISYTENTKEISDQVSSELIRLDGVTSVSRLETTRETFTSSMESVDYAVIIIIVCAAALAFVVLFNLTNINITERMRELATLKVLGFNEREMGAYVYRENVVLTLFGVALGLVLGKLLHQWLILTVEIDMAMFGRSAQPMSYLYAIGLTILFSLLVNLLANRKLRKIDMVESLKSVE